MSRAPGGAGTGSGPGPGLLRRGAALGAAGGLGGRARLAVRPGGGPARPGPTLPGGGLQGAPEEPGPGLGRVGTPGKRPLPAAPRPCRQAGRGAGPGVVARPLQKPPFIAGWYEGRIQGAPVVLVGGVWGWDCGLVKNLHCLPVWFLFCF